MKRQFNTLLFGSCLAAAGMVLSPGHVMAQVYLNNGGSQVYFNLGDTPGGSGLIGMNSWMVNTEPSSQLVQQWYWYSVNGGPIMSIDQNASYTITSQTSSSVSVLYSTPSQVDIEVSYSLSGDTGGGDLSESVSVVNESSAAATVNFYQYANFNLLGNSENTLYVIPASAPQTGYGSVYQTTTGDGNGIQETIDSPNANFAEAGAGGTGPGTVMADMLEQDLDGNLTASGDVAWAFEWQSTVPVFNDDPDNVWGVLQNQNMSIQPVPEPSTIALIALGLGACGLVRRRQSL